MPSSHSSERRYRFRQLDVFTDRLFGGNPLAVFLDADDLETATMQQIAREMNLSETTFVMRPQRDDTVARVRVFTPGRELPFAGHPTVGTAYVLDALGSVHDDRFGLELNVGRVAIVRDGKRFWIAPPAAAAIGGEFDTRAVATALSVEKVERAQMFGSEGVHFLCIALASRSAVDAVTIERSALADASNAEAAAGNVLVASYEGGEGYVRMFADLASNIGEDPATGSAMAPLVAALDAWNVLDAARCELVVRQGVAMGRASDLYVRFKRDGSTIASLEVGGDCVPVFESELAL